MIVKMRFPLTKENVEVVVSTGLGTNFEEGGHHSYYYRWLRYTNYHREPFNTNNGPTHSENRKGDHLQIAEKEC